jgi:hypothetical protein
MAKVFALLPANWEYNDETYDLKGFGEPSRAFKSRKKADEALLDAFIDEVGGSDLYEKFYDPDDYGINGDAIQDAVRENKGHENYIFERDNNYIIPSDLSRESWKKIIAAFGDYEFYKVVEIEVE